MKEKTDKVSSLQTPKEVEQVTSLSEPLNEAQSEAQSGRLTLGFLTPGIQIDSRFHEAWMGICDAARDQNVNLICFSAGRLSTEATRRENKHKVLCDLITPDRLDGLITFEWWRPEEFERVCSRYRPLPIVNLMGEIDGYSVSLSHSDVMRVKLEHLIEVHGYRRIAYLRGPEADYSAQVQYQTYVDVLTEYGLPPDPVLTVPFPMLADHEHESHFERGKEAIRVLLDERKIRPGKGVEVILGFSDGMTMGILEALRERGIGVPYDVAVVGSGGQEAARFTAPPLTTTAPPYYEMGRKAVEVLISVLAEEAVSEQTTLPVRLHVRRSCGCLEPSITQAAADTIPGSGESFEAVVADQREKILSAMAQAAGGGWDRLEGWAERLLDAFVAEVTASKATEAGEFILTLEDILYQADRAGGEVSLGHDVLSALHVHILPCLSHDVDLWGQADGLWQQGRVLVHVIAQRTQMRWQAQKEQEAMALRDIGQQLLSTFDVADLMNVLAEGLPRLGIPGCYLSLYENPLAPLEGARLVLGYDEANAERSSDAERPRGRIDLGPDGQDFPSTQLVPAGILPQNRCFNLLVESLHFGEEQLGFVAFEADPRDERTIYNILRGEISNALYGALLAQQEEKRSQQLQTVAEVSTGVSTVLDTTQLLQRVVDLTKERFNLYHAHIYLLNETTSALELVAGAGEVGRQMVAEAWSISFEAKQSLVTRAARFREGVIVNDVRGDPDWLPNPLLPKTRSELAIPLIAGGRVLGVLDVQASQVNYFTGDDIQIQSMLAAQVAVALENARLFEETQTTLAETSSLYQASRHINEANDVQEMIAAIAEVESASEINRLMVEVFERDSAGEIEALVVSANWHSGQGTSPPPVGTRVRVAKIPYLDLLLSNEPIFFDDVLHDERLGLEAMTLIQQSSTQAMAILPLWVGTRQLGDLIIEVEKVHHFTERERRIYTSLAGQAAVAVENQRLLAETQAILTEMEATQRRFTIQAWEAYRSRKVTKGYEQVRESVIPLKDDLPPEAIETISHEQPTLSTDGGKSEGLVVKVADRDGPNEKLPVEAKSSLVVPLTVRGEVVGVLGLQETDEAREWTPEEISLVEAIAQQIAQAAENLRLIDETQQRAAREARIGEIGEKIRGAQSLEEALQVAIKEVGLSLKAPQTTVQLEVK